MIQPDDMPGEHYKDEQQHTSDQPPTQALTVRDAQQAIQALEQKVPTTAAQAKVEAVASLTFKAYERASTLQLTQEEIKALQAEFPDEAFKPGAAGKENLIYIEHAFLRDRLNEVIGVGQWSLIPRSRWAEDFVTAKGQEASRVYVEAMLVVRGCFVAEAVGEMEYWKNNASQNYGDAVEGAKTAALRRCCKEFGIGLQAWKKDWCDGWWQRKRQGQQRVPAIKTADQVAKWEESVKANPPRRVTPERNPTAASTSGVEANKKRLLEIIADDAPELWREFADKAGLILPTESLTDWPLDCVPISKEQMDALSNAVRMFADGERAELPFKRNDVAADRAPKPASPPSVARNDVSPSDEAWREFPMPWGEHAGTPLDELDRKYLYGLWANYKVETEYKGKPKRPESIAKDQQFREMLDACGEHYQFTIK